MLQGGVWTFVLCQLIRVCVKNLKYFTRSLYLTVQSTIISSQYCVPCIARNSGHYVRTGLDVVGVIYKDIQSKQIHVLGILRFHESMV